MISANSFDVRTVNDMNIEHTTDNRNFFRSCGTRIGNPVLWATKTEKRNQTKKHVNSANGLSFRPLQMVPISTDLVEPSYSKHVPYFSHSFAFTSSFALASPFAFAVSLVYVEVLGFTPRGTEPRDAGPAHESSAQGSRDSCDYDPVNSDLATASVSKPCQKVGRLLRG